MFLTSTFIPGRPSTLVFFRRCSGSPDGHPRGGSEPGATPHPPWSRGPPAGPCLGLIIRCDILEEALVDQEIGAGDWLSQLLDFTPYKAHLPTAVFQLLVLFLLLPKFPLQVTYLNTHENGLEMVCDSHSAAQSLASSCPPARHMSWGGEGHSTGLCRAQCLLVLLATGSCLGNPGQSRLRRRGKGRLGTTLTETFHSPFSSPM